MVAYGWVHDKHVCVAVAHVVEIPSERCAYKAAVALDFCRLESMKISDRAT